METIEKKETKAKKGANLKKGESLIWDAESKMDLGEFLDFAINGLNHHFRYNQLVFGFKLRKNLASCKEPSVVGTCRGKVELAKLIKLFSECGFVCAVEEITEDTKKIHHLASGYR